MRTMSIPSAAGGLPATNRIGMTKTLLAYLALAGALAAQPAYDLLLKGGHVIDPKNKISQVMDVAIAGGKIARVAKDIPASEAKKTANVTGLYVAPGLIDIHAHVYARATSVQPDAFSFRSGVTTMVDAGTSGAKTFPDFKQRIIDHANTRVLAFLNIVAAGMGTGQENDPAEMDPDAAAKMAQANPDVIVGFKSAHYNGKGWESIDCSVKAGRMTDLPVMVDFGYVNEVRNIRTLLADKLRPGDIYTHCFSGHREELMDNGKVNPAMITGRKRGIFFDVGHGAGSFYWYVAVPFFQQKFYPDSISTDLHTGSMNAGMKDMANVMSKILNLGSPLEEVIRMSTWGAANEIKRPKLGNLDVGADADVAVLRVDKGQFGFVDSAGARDSGTQLIVCELTLRNGKVAWDLNGRASEDWKSFKYQKRVWTR
jgi:dihydroorotase